MRQTVTNVACPFCNHTVSIVKRSLPAMAGPTGETGRPCTIGARGFLRAHPEGRLNQVLRPVHGSSHL